MDPISIILNVGNYIINSSAYLAQFIRFVGSTLITAALSGSKQPKLQDLKVQTSAYGAPIPRLYGSEVRVAGNVIDKSDLIPVKHKKGEMLGVGGVKYYTYDAHVAVLICEGPITADALVRIYADGKLFFDRDADGATAPTATAEGGMQWSRTNKTHSNCDTITLYPGSSTQGVDPTLQALEHNVGQNLSAYRHSVYVVIKRLTCSDYGNRVPNLEFVVEPSVTVLGDIVEELASYAGCTVDASALTETVRGFAVGQEGTVWDAIQPLASSFFFDLVKTRYGFEALKRGRSLRTIIPETKWAARKTGEDAATTKSVKITDPNKYPDELTISYFDPGRDFQVNTQRAGRNVSYAKNKLSAQVPIVFTADEARNVAERTLHEALSRSRSMTIDLPREYRWLVAADNIGLEVAGNVEVWRIENKTDSPNQTIALEVVSEDPYNYISNLTGAAGDFPVNDLGLPGDSILQPIDGPILRTADDSTGFYMTLNGTGTGWRGSEVSRALGVGSPLTYTVIGNAGVGAAMADCDTTLASGPVDVWDEVNTLTVTMIGGELTSATAEEILTTNANLAWVGGEDGEDGELINFRTATAGSPEGVYVLSGLLRGRYGTEAASATHGVGERLVLLSDTDAVYRVDFGAADWNAARTYQAASIPEYDNPTDTVEFTNTGRGKRPLAPVHLTGTRNGSNNDVAIAWTRRTRFTPPAIGGGAVPLGEDAEVYALDIYAGSTVVRTLTTTTPTFNYTDAMQTADGNTPGAAVRVDVYQVSGTFGRGEVAEGLV